MDRTTDQRLIAGILNKDQAIIWEFVQRHERLVYLLCRRMLGNDMDAEEASQDALLKAIDRVKRFEGRSKLSTWVHRITYTTCLDVLKKRKRRDKEVDIEHVQLQDWNELGSGFRMLHEKEQRMTIDQAIGLLDETDALLIDMYHLQEYSIAELSKITEMNESAIKVRLFRARKKLAMHLESLLPHETIKEIRHESSR